MAATTADLTFAGGAATAISVALSGTEIYKAAASDTKPLAKEMARSMDAALAQGHLTDQRKRIVAQMLGKYQPSELESCRPPWTHLRSRSTYARVSKPRARDPAHHSQTALRDFAQVGGRNTRTSSGRSESCRTNAPQISQQLLANTQSSGKADRLREEGITERRLSGWPSRYSAGAQDVGQAWLELQNAMDVAVRVQQEGHINSNHGDFVDTVLKRVSELAADGAYPDASAGN